MSTAERYVLQCKCSGGRRCPDVRPEGDGIVISEEQSELRALEAPRMGLVLSREQAQELRRVLEKLGF